MKRPRLVSGLLSTLAAVALLRSGVPSACARGNGAPPARHHPPLQLHVDTAPINRRSADPISFAPVLEKSAASVVYVYSTKEVRSPAPSYFADPLLRQLFGLGGSGGEIPPETEHGLGSGIVVSKDGYIITNNHVVAGATDVKVSIGDSLRRYDATIIGTDRLADVAVLKINAEGLVPATLGDSDQLKVGDVVLAIGDPFGIGQSVSRGIVSAVGRGNLGIEAVEDFIQTDAAINPGNSGGALLDAEGRVVGLNTAILSRSGGFAGVGFAIPINLVRRVAQQIVTTGHVTRGFLGISPQRLTPELAQQFGSYSGALIAEVSPGSPAQRAGLKPGDVITRINNTKIRDAGHLLFTISQLAPGTRITIHFLRDQRHETATAVLSQRPQQTLAEEQQNAPGAANAPQPGRSGGALNGVVVADLSPRVRDELQIPRRVQGAVIAQVDPASAAAAQGLRPGDVILELNHQPVRNADDCVRLSDQIKGSRVLARVWRNGTSEYVVIDATNP